MDKFKISESENRLAKFLKALGNPVRLAIIRTLIEKSQCPNGCHPCSCGDLCEGMNCKCGCKCGELVNLFPMAQSTISQHIKELKNVGLIETNGRKDDYILNYDNLKIILNSLNEMAGFLNDNNRHHCCHCSD